jgi:hypothetical protein
MANSHNKDNKLVVLQSADHSKIFNAVTPQTSFVTRQLLSEISWVFCHPFPQIRQDSFLDSVIE